MKNLSSRRAKALAIPSTVKARVWERDQHRCIFCGAPDAFPECHYISRAHGGLGIEENIFTGCRMCHDRYDHGDQIQRAQMKERAKELFEYCYPGWDESKLIYRKEL